MEKIRAVVALLVVSLLAGCGYNEIQSKDEAVTAAWSEVLNQYQRRADLIPNLVATAQGYIQHERSILIEVTEARSRVGSIQATPELVNDPEAFAKFQAAQANLTSALSRLLVVAENYPNLKADARFAAIEDALEGSENRIAVARNRYIAAVQDFNTTVRRFPTNLTAMMFGHDVKPNFTVENEAAISKPPTVDFSRPAPAQPAPTPAPAPAPAR